MATFADALVALKVQLQTAAAINSYAQQVWNKAPSVRLEFRRRPEIAMDQLPVILITSPSVTSRQRIGAGRAAVHRVRLYCGFYQPDRAKAVIEQIMWEELIDAAIEADPSIGDHVEDVTVRDSANDEGVFHPSYFTVMDMDVRYSGGLVDASTLDDFMRAHVDYDINQDGMVDASDFIILPH